MCLKDKKYIAKNEIFVKIENIFKNHKWLNDILIVRKYNIG